MCPSTLPSDDHFHDQCGVFGIYGPCEAANIAYLGLYALQHRGQDRRASLPQTAGLCAFTRVLVWSRRLS